jgi:integrase
MPITKPVPRKAVIYSPADVKKIVTFLKKKGDEPKAKAALLYVAIGAFAGLRPVEVIGLDWSAIDFAKKQIFLSVEVTRSRFARVVPLKPNLLAFLAPYKGSKGRVINQPGVSRILSRYCKEAGVEPIPNGLRYSYATYWLGGGSDAELANEMGLSPTVSRHIRKPVSSAMAAKYWAIEP